MGIDLNTGYKGSERHGAAKGAFKPLRVVLFGDETNSLFCDARDELRNLGHDVITKPASEFQIGDLKKLVKDFDVIYPMPNPVIKVEDEPVEVVEEEEEEIEEEDAPKEPTDDMDDNSDEEADVDGEEEQGSTSSSPVTV